MSVACLSVWLILIPIPTHMHCIRTINWTYCCCWKKRNLGKISRKLMNLWEAQRMMKTYDDFSFMPHLVEREWLLNDCHYCRDCCYSFFDFGTFNVEYVCCWLWPSQLYHILLCLVNVECFFSFSVISSSAATFYGTWVLRLLFFSLQRSDVSTNLLWAFGTSPRLSQYFDLNFWIWFETTAEQDQRFTKKDVA